MASSSSSRSDVVTITTPVANSEVRSPLNVRGEARGTWFFEGSIPLQIVDASDNVIVEAAAQADGEWMTEDFVSFETTLSFNAENRTEGALVIQKSNPSGLPENDASVRIPITLVPDTDTEGDVTIEQEFEGKIVYGSSQADEEGIEAMQTDCAQRGGTFNECGSPCAPDADTCITVCAYTCTTGETTSITNTQWEAYENGTVGIRLDYPSVMIREPSPNPVADASVSFVYRGSTQTEGTELFDGISITVSRGRHDVPLETYVEAQMEDARNVGSITQSEHIVRLADQDAIAYTAVTLGTHDHYFIPLENDQYLHVSTMSPDPENVGYDEVVADILATLEITG